jgi:hypothetical protein
MNGFYINLKHRKERNEHILKLKSNNPFLRNIKRFDAIYDDKYGVGCIKSHIQCLEKCLKMNDEYYIILEDDFKILNQKNFDEFIQEFNSIKNNDNWDVILLTPRGTTKHRNYINNFNRIVDSQTTTGYIIKYRMIEKLLSTFKKARIGLELAKNRKETHIYCADQCWKPLQKESIWLYFHKIFGGQLEGYSDIEKKSVNYNKEFIKQIFR